ncbi:hypothetical protein F5Y14DRAFT_283976 [Nemania sp. NC0429]|nr:hypothetical protein F5Y14DRAFT_283976 [Nemania sp. NC0429]
MGQVKDQMMEAEEEERQNVEQALEDIEAYGDRYQCPNEHCRDQVCSKKCFAGGCFDWCLTHERPSVEEIHGTVSVEIRHITTDAEGNSVSYTEVEKRRVCGHENANANASRGDCNIIIAPFAGRSDFDEYQMEREILEMIAKE